MSKHSTFVESLVFSSSKLLISTPDHSVRVSSSCQSCHTGIYYKWALPKSSHFLVSFVELSIMRPITPDLCSYTKFLNYLQCSLDNLLSLFIQSFLYVILNTKILWIKHSSIFPSTLTFLNPHKNEWGQKTPDGAIIFSSNMSLKSGFFPTKIAQQL